MALASLPATAEGGSVPVPVPGQRTLRNFLATALSPIGSTLYVWGGGWNEEDTGAGTEAVSIGLGPEWKSFYDSHGSDYDFDDYRYLIHSGLDCSGFVGWAIYNTFNSTSGGDGYVMGATRMAAEFSRRGWETFFTDGGQDGLSPPARCRRQRHV